MELMSLGPEGLLQQGCVLSALYSGCFHVLSKSNVGVCGHCWPQTRRIIGWGQICTGTTFEKSELFILSFCKAPHSAFGHSLVKRSRPGRADSANLDFWLCLWFLLLEDMNQIFLNSLDSIPIPPGVGFLLFIS